MSEAHTATQQQPAEAPSNPPEASAGISRVQELKVSGHLMTLDPGLFCVSQIAGSAPPDPMSGLPGVRISLPPGPGSRPEAVRISTFRDDGWLEGRDGAALVRVIGGPAHLLVTIYQAPNATPAMAPRLQVMRLGADPGDAAAAAQVVGRSAVPETAELLVHVQRTGDVGVQFGEWAGSKGSGLWIEGFGLIPRAGIAATDVEYQAVLGRGWLSPWIEGGKFCGSRGMALPLLGVKIRLKGEAAKTHRCSYSASFVDGTSIGPVPGGETCEAPSLAALESLQVVVESRERPAAESAPPRRARAPRAKRARQ